MKRQDAIGGGYISTREKTAIAEKVAKAWGVDAPYPSSKVENKFRRWEYYEACGTPSWRRRNLRVPDSYLSWAHIAAFLNFDFGRDNRRLGAKAATPRLNWVEWWGDRVQ
jgi:hypothetical protein